MNPKPRLLLIDDDPEDRALATVVLSAALPGVRIESVDEALPDLSVVLGDGVFDLVVTDLETRTARGAFLVRMIRTRQPRAGIIVFTRTDDRDSAVAAMKAGADDFLVKSSAGFLRLGQSAAEALAELRAGQNTARPEDAPLVQPLPAPVPHLEPEAELESAPQPLGFSAPRETPGALRVAVERARRSVAAVQGRSLGAVLGIIVILAVFSLLAASFFAGDSESVEAESVEAQSVEMQAVEVPPAPSLAADREVRPGRSAARGPEPSAVDSAAAGGTPQGIGEEAGIDASAAESRAPVSSETEMPVVVRLEATAEVWVQGTTDGRPTLDRVLASGEVFELRGLETATLLIGNAAGLRILWNGEDLGALGDQGQVRRLYFTPDRVGVGSLPSG